MGKYRYVIILLLFGKLMFSQNGAVSLARPDSGNPVPPPPPYIYESQVKPPKMEPMGSSVMKPTLGLGIGMMSFYGDVKPKAYFQNPSVARLGYDITLSQKLNDYLTVNLYGLFGKVGVTEDRTNRNWNFESQITLGGLNLQYNFDQLLPKNRNVDPIIMLGFESFNFVSKTDMYDKNGNKYYYWSDGSIKNVANQNDPNAVNIVRDYKYETDIRELNLDNFGKYSEYSFAIPVGIGAVFHLSERVDLKLHTTMHFTFTDYIDGITNKSLGNRQGNSKNDNFMMTGFSLHWDLLGPKVPVDTLGKDWFNNVDFAALENADSDGDGVRDTMDRCPGTPPGVPVDGKGCPFDNDGDGVPDFADKELDSKPMAVVDMNGVTVPDSIVKKHYEQFYDSTNQFAEVIYHFHGEYGRGVAPTEQLVKETHTSDGTFVPSEYLVLLGTYKSGLPPETMAKFLSIRDIETTPLADSTIAYTVGHYKTFAEAQSRKKLSVKGGMNDAKVVYKKDGKFIEATSDMAPTTIAKNNKGSEGTNPKNTGKQNGKYLPDGTNVEDSLQIANTKGVVFRIQLGAYKRRISKAVFGNAGKTLEARTEDGLYKYMTGSYATFNEAAKAKVDLALKGYGGAFITAYKDGKRVTLTSVGATPSGKSGLKENVNEVEKPVTAVSKKSVVFKVQVGVFKNEPPADKQAKYKEIKGGVQQETTSTGLIRYTTGSTNDYAEAQKIKNKMKALGIDDAFVIAFFNGQYITIQEALEISK